MPKLSVTIVTYNEEKNIRDCLKSVSFADEIIVVDGNSKDFTVKIAREMGAKVFSVPNEPLMKKNMNLSFEKASCDWILSLDADECISPELAKEIRETLEKPGEFIAFRIPRKNRIFGKDLEYTGWYPDYQERLFKKGKAKYPAKNVHEGLLVDGKIGTLENPIIHYHYQSVSEWISKLDSYTNFEAKKLIEEGKKIKWSDSISFPLEEFLSRFFLRKGYKDGLHGLVLSLLMAFYWELIFVKIWEHEKYWSYNGENFLSETVAETKQISRKFHHWVGESSKNPVTRMSHKIKKHL